MRIIGCDFHTRYQQIAMLDTETGELVERRLEHENGEARAFYASLPKPVLVGMEATGHAQWFERTLAELGHELSIGHASEIRAGVVRKQKTDARDANHLLHLLLEKRFPRIWIPSPAERDARQLLRHRYKLVCFRTSVKNQLHALAMGQGVCWKKKLFTARGREELEKLPLGPWASRRRQELLDMLDRFNPLIDELDRAVQQQAESHAEAARLMAHPGVGPVTALAFVLTLGPVARFRRSKHVVSYLGLNPKEHSSGGHQHMSSISKQGNTMMRWLLVEAGQTAVRFDPELLRLYQRLKFRKGASVAKVAIARKLAVRLYWMLRATASCAQRAPMQGSPRGTLVPQVGSSF
jgi:transposase